MDIDSSNSTPVDNVESKEFSDNVLKVGSFISMVENKKLNLAMVFSLILQKAKYQKFLVEMTSSDCFESAVTQLLHLNPTLIKSKHTKAALRKLASAKNTNDGTGKATIQQTPSGIKKRKKQTV